MSQPSFSSVPRDEDVEPSGLPDNGNAVYDALRAELAKPVETELLALPVPSRPGVEVLFEPAIEWDMFDMWMKRAARNKEKRVNPLVVSFQVLSHSCRGVKVGGKVVQSKDGSDITFASEDLQNMVGAKSTTECIRKLYGRDGHILQTSGRVLDEAGYGDVDLEDDGGSDPL